MPAESALSLVEKLRAAFDRAEEIARAVEYSADDEWWTADTLSADWLAETDATFVAANGPDVVLRTVAAHRRLIDLAERADQLEQAVDDAFRVGPRDEASNPYLGDLILAALAAVYFPEAPDGS